MTQILHITHIANLAKILHSGGLWSPNHISQDLAPYSSAYAQLQERRAMQRVPVGAGGVLHDYVPFYFGARSPMLFANHKGQVPSNSDGQRSIIYLVSTAEAVASHSQGWVFTDGHAVIRWTRFFDDLSALDQVDWPTVHSKFWHDIPNDPDRKRRKQSEFLVHRFFSLALVTELVVIDNEIALTVQELLNKDGHSRPVAVRPAWYY